MGILKSLNPEDYHVTLIAPETFTTFTPLLPCEFLFSFASLDSDVWVAAAVGTVQVRSLIEPLRKIIARIQGHYIQGKATDLVMGERLVEVETVVDGEKRNLYVPYDKLVIAVGSTSTTHGIDGLEHSFQLKTVGDAQEIRRRISGEYALTFSRKRVH